LVHLVLIFVQVIMASLAIVGRIVLREIPPGVLVLMRIWGAASVLAIARHLFDPGVRLNRRDLAQFAFLGLLGVAGNQSLLLFGLSHSTAINATILIATIPAFTVLLSIVTRREPPSGLKVSGIGLAAAGTIYLIGPDQVSLAPAFAFGNALLVLGVICYALYLTYSREVLQRYRAVTATATVMLFGALGVTPVGLYGLTRMRWGEVHSGTWLLAGYVVLFPTIVAYFLNLWALRRVSSNLVAAYIYVQPVLTVVTAPLVLEDEHLTTRAALAGLAIFAGLALVILGEQRQRRAVRVESLPGE